MITALTVAKIPLKLKLCLVFKRYICLKSKTSKSLPVCVLRSGCCITGKKLLLWFPVQLYTPFLTPHSVLHRCCVVLVVNGLWHELQAGKVTQDKTLASGLLTHTATLTTCLKTPPPLCTAHSSCRDSGGREWWWCRAPLLELRFGRKTFHRLRGLCKVCVLACLL